MILAIVLNKLFLMSARTLSSRVKGVPGRQNCIVSMTCVLNGR